MQMRSAAQFLMIIFVLSLFIALACSTDSSDEQSETDDDANDDDTDISHEFQPAYINPTDCEEGQEYTEPYPEIIRGPYLQMVGPNSIVIVWYTDRPSNSVVKYGIGGINLSFCDFAKAERHEVALEYLSPYSEYEYIVRSDGAQKGPFTFKTAPKILSTKSFRFGAYADSHVNYEVHNEVSSGLLAEDPDFFIHVGDTVNDGNIFDQYDEGFFNPASELIANTPFYISIGNHEMQSDYFYDFFTFPEPDLYFSFTYGNAYFIALNTNLIYVRGSPQYVWFEQELQRANELGFEWLIVFAHHPPYCEGWGHPGYNGELLVRLILVPLFEQYGVDIYFSGHAHDYERGELNGVVYIITGGGGGALDSWQQDFPHITVYEAAHHYTLVDVEDKSLTLKGCYPDGNCFDELNIAH